MNEVNTIAQSILKDTIGGLVLQGIQDAARIKFLEAEIERLNKLVKPHQ